MRLIETAVSAINYDADEHNFVVWDETYTEEVARTATFADAKTISQGYGAYLDTGDATALQDLCAMVDGKDVSFIAINADLQLVREQNNQLQAMRPEGSMTWHKHETIDDILHKILD